MNPFETYFIAVFVVNACLGIGVFLTNRTRTLNQNYLTASILIAWWLALNWMILKAHSETSAEFLIRSATAIALTLPVSAHLLRLSILFPSDNWLRILLRAKFLFMACFGIALICFTPPFIKTVRMPSDATQIVEIPEPVYGWGYFVFAVFLLGMLISLLALFIGDRKKTSGLQRIELDFITTGYCAALATAALFGVIVTVFTASSRTVPMANASSILAFTSIISYGIATKRILDIATIARRFVAYVFLASYLTILYLATWHGVVFAMKYLQVESTWIAQIIATLTVAFAMAPANGLLQRFTNKLIASESMDVPVIMKKAGNIFQTMSTVDDLLNCFAQLLIDSLGAEHIQVLFLTGDGFVQSHPPASPDKRIALASDNALTAMMREENEPVSLDSLTRGRQTPMVQAATRELKQLNGKVAVGIFSKSKITGMVLFGERLNGRIYDKTEQDALQILCNQFAVALENARLYTEMQDSRIRNEIMLDQLVSGVVVADPERKVVLINNEAERITGLAEKDILGQDIGLLPKPIFQTLETTLAKGSGVHHIDAALIGEEESTSVRMGSAFLIGHDDKPMGALLVFTDTTELKTLEEQVRRADQLSSVGTLAAGMAHEIKNPLVTIKTFTQLLPERYADTDFRTDFSALVADEVARIDSIVNQLLSFSKPPQPHLVPTRLHDTVEQTLKLIHEKLSQKDIVLKKNFRAKRDLISGDAALLTQALVNLNLNAIDAIGDGGGTIDIETTNCTHRFAHGADPRNATTAPCIRLKIGDTGKGMPKDQVKKIFDPFYTTKSEGTGMGLSVVHGIIQEHRGAIEVRSEPNKGTAFFIYLPLLKEEPTP